MPRIFEKLYTLVTAQADPAAIAGATQVGLAVRALQAQGKPVPAELQAHFDRAEEQLFGKVRAAFGGNLDRAVTGAAPIAKEILEFFFACGVPVLEGYGLTETATVATASSIEDHRLGSVGRALPGMEIRIADDGEVLAARAQRLPGLPRQRTTPRSARSSTAGCTPAISGAWTRTATSTSPAARRTSSSRAAARTSRRRTSRTTSSGPAGSRRSVMHGDRRPYPVALVTLDEEEIAGFASERGLPADVATLAREPEVHALVQGVVDAANERYSQAERIKRFHILDHDFSQETGELTPTLKVKRNVVPEKYAAVLDGLYAD